MKRENARQILLGLANNATSEDRGEAIVRVMDEVGAEPQAWSWSIPFAGPRYGSIKLPYPLDQHDWAHLLGVLEAMRDVLVNEVDERPGPTDSEARSCTGM